MEDGKYEVNILDTENKEWSQYRYEFRNLEETKAAKEAEKVLEIE